MLSNVRIFPKFFEISIQIYQFVFLLIFEGLILGCVETDCFRINFHVVAALKNIFQALQDVRIFAPLQIRQIEKQFSCISANFVKLQQQMQQICQVLFNLSSCFNICHILLKFKISAKYICGLKNVAKCIIVFIF